MSSLFSRIARDGGFEQVEDIAACFNVTGVAERFDRAYREKKKEPLYFPDIPLRLPFEQCWFEWRNPTAGEYYTIPTKDGGVMLQAGCLCRTVPREEEPIIVMMPVVRCAGQDWTAGKALVTVVLDDDGCMKRWGYVYAPEARNDHPTLRETNENFSLLICSPALGALQLMNCRNVDHQPTGQRSFPVPKKKRKSAAAKRGIEWHELVIRHRSTHKSGNSPREPQALNRQHLCRGHFKTYTKNRPLLGKHVGTWWWSPQWRGTGPGTVLKDYRVEEPN